MQLIIKEKEDISLRLGGEDMEGVQGKVSRRGWEKEREGESDVIYIN